MSEESNREEKVKDPIAERKAKEIKEGFLNPFGEKTSYKEFLEQVEKSKKSIAEYCKGKITADQIDWLENELSIINKK